ncbi:MAG: 30S ribosome-binding factor RbfA [Bdellovibrionaceae bacterium]|jgi:ribosome-binding factor A|nr:30S ribosome-binding factor RbfA [Pseudobdellovibrionaceae bacterium]
MNTEGSSRRVLRVSKEMRQIVSKYLVTSLNEPSLGLVSVTEVKVHPNLRSARIYLSFINCEEETDFALGLVQKKAGAIQRIVGSEIRMKFCPKITFLHDQGIENSLRISSLLKEAKVQASEEE